MTPEERKRLRNKRIVYALLDLVVFLSVCGIYWYMEQRTPTLPASSYIPASSQVVQSQPEGPEATPTPAAPQGFTLAQVPEYSGEPYVAVHDNVPYFTQADLTERSFETYSPLDELGRCGVAYANVGRDLMPTEKRGDIHHIRPTGWQSVRYDFVDGGSLYNRCHLLGFQLTAENDNKLNLVTGTRSMNTKGMLPFENIVADYVKETDNHVLYRVTPIYEGSELVARGVLMEGWSVEDEGDGVSFCVYAYNVEPRVAIDYATGDNWEVKSGKEMSMVGSPSGTEEQRYVLNVKSHKFHRPDCPGIQDISKENKELFTGTRQQLIDEGYKPCGNCKP